VDTKKNNTVLEKPRIVFGGINPEFVLTIILECIMLTNIPWQVTRVVHSIYLFQVHASQTEEFLNGKALDTKTIQGAMDVLEKELNPDEKPPDASPEYRKTLAQALLYKVRAKFHATRKYKMTLKSILVSWFRRQFWVWWVPLQRPRIDRVGKI
jgi:hypothetical protein